VTVGDIGPKLGHSLKDSDPVTLGTVIIIDITTAETQVTLLFIWQISICFKLFKTVSAVEIAKSKRDVLTLALGASFIRIDKWRCH
jgi:hypothetical protein